MLDPEQDIDMDDSDYPDLRTYRVTLERGAFELAKYPQEVVQAHFYVCDGDVVRFFILSMNDGEPYTSRSLRNWVDVEEVTGVVPAGSSRVS